jgi:hypothetical protein
MVSAKTSLTPVFAKNKKLPKIKTATQDADNNIIGF